MLRRRDYLLLENGGLDSDLSVLQPSDAAAHSTFTEQIAALRVPFSRHPRRAAGENLQTSCLLTRQRNGGDRSGTELDHLFAADAAHTRIAEESEVLAGLRPNGRRVQTRFEKASQPSAELL